MDFYSIKTAVTEILETKEISINHKLSNICNLLEAEISCYDWVGFYFKNGDKDELKLKAFAGEPTEHTIIPFGKGICGQVAVSNQNFTVADVQEQNNYIACNIHTKAEIVVPLFFNGENIGQIDIDSHTANPFTQEDEALLEFINEKVAGILNPDFCME